MTDPTMAPPVSPAKRAPNPGGYTLPPMPATLPAIRSWVRTIQDAYSQGLIRSGELAEARRSAAAVADLQRTAADLRKAKAAERAASAEERMADMVASFQHGGPAVALLARLRELPGAPRALPFRRTKAGTEADGA